MLQPMEEMIVPPKRQAVVDRLRRRIETYRRRQSECVPRFDQSFSGACEQQNLETTALQKRFLEGKAKRQAKKNDRKPDLPAISGNLHSSVHVQQKFGCGDYEPPAKLQCGGGEALTKFSVEIVQQLEFTTSAADSQPQQISTNVTVKALANAVKTSNSPPPPAGAPPPQPARPPTPLDCERECKAECKSEIADDEFVGLDECAAALERDAAAAFPGLADLIGEDDGDEITSFEDLITEISEYPEFMKDFDLDSAKLNGALGPEPPEGEPAPRPYAGEMSPAAQTLKHMAEQHQQAGGEWARYRSGPGGPGAFGASAGGGAGPGAYRPRPTLDHLHLSQAQQLHITQPHHNLQVSAAQHMQVSAPVAGAGAGAGAHVSAAAHQGLYASFSHASGAPSPQHHQGAGMCDTYTMSQSQSMNFSPQMRTRPPAPAPAQPPAPQSAPPLVGVAAAGLSREQQAKMLQQQQQHMLRVQQMRPPPPEYKARFAPASVMGGAPGTARRPPAAAAAVGRGFPHSRAYSPEWRQMLMQQQSAARQPFQHHHQGFMGGTGGSVLSAQQQQQIQQARLQHQQQLMHHQQRTQNQQQSPMSHLIMHQNQMLSVQGQIPNIHMTQSQSVSMQQAGMGGHQGSPMSNPNTMSSQNMHQTSPMQPQTNSLLIPNGSMQAQNINNNQHQSFSLHNTSSFPAQTADFNLDFLDNMPSTDMNTAQELLNSLDNSFLNDIL